MFRMILQSNSALFCITMHVNLMGINMKRFCQPIVWDDTSTSIHPYSEIWKLSQAPQAHLWNHLAMSEEPLWWPSIEVRPESVPAEWTSLKILDGYGWPGEKYKQGGISWGKCEHGLKRNLCKKSSFSCSIYRVNKFRDVISQASKCCIAEASVYPDKRVLSSKIFSLLH